MREKYLPIGSVVQLRGATKYALITGYLVVKKDENNKLYDYMGCVYPIGIVDININALFNHEDIEKIISIGYEDEECKKFLEQLKESQINTNSNEEEVL